MRVQIGKMRHRVTVQSATETRDATGAVTRTWASEGKRWAKIDYLSGAEGPYADQQQATRRYSVAMHRHDTIVPTWRILWGVKTLNVESVLADDQDRDKTFCLCTELV